MKYVAFILILLFTAPAYAEIYKHDGVYRIRPTQHSRTQQYHKPYQHNPYQHQRKTIQQKRQEEILENQRRIINNQEDMQRLQDQQRSWDFINRRNR